MRIGRLLWMAALWLSAPCAYAQGGDKATAELLFNEGRQLLEQNKLDSACDKLAESQRLDPAVGTLLNLAECQERRGQTASAWATWLEAAAGAKTAGQPEREAHARKRAEALKPRLVTLTIDVPEGNRVQGLKVTRDGTEIGRALWGTAAPVDPGEHTLAASAPGFQAWSSAVAVRDGSSASVVVPPLQPAQSAPPPAASVAPARAPTQPQEAPAERSARGMSPWVYVASGVGLVGVGVGSLFGLRAAGKNADSEKECSTDTLCNRDGLKLRNEAFDAARVSTLGFIVGGAGAAAAAVLWVTSSGESSKPIGGAQIRRVGLSVGRRDGVLSVEGAF